jgi:hypothetical protein
LSPCRVAGLEWMWARWTWDAHPGGFVCRLLVGPFSSGTLPSALEAHHVSTHPQESALLVRLDRGWESLNGFRFQEWKVESNVLIDCSSSASPESEASVDQRSQPCPLLMHFLLKENVFPQAQLDSDCRSEEAGGNPRFLPR